MKVSIVVDMENSSDADRRLVNELLPLLRSMTHTITILNQDELPPAPQQGLPAVSLEDCSQAPQQQGQPAAASLQRHPSHLSSQGSLQRHPSDLSSQGSLLPAPDGAARPQGPQGLQQEKPTPGAGSGRLPPNYDAPLYRPPALRDAAGLSGSPAPLPAHGPAKHVLPPPGFKQPQARTAPQPNSPLRSALQPEAELRPEPQPGLHDPLAPRLAPAPRPTPPPVAPAQRPALQQQAPPVAIAAPVVDDPEKVLAPLTIRFAEVLRGAIQSSREEATKELNAMMERQKFTEVAWQHLAAAANLVIFDMALSRKRTPVHGLVDALMSLHDRKPKDQEVLLKDLLARAWWILCPPQPCNSWQQLYPAMAFIVSCMRYTGRGGMSMPDVADTIANHLLPEPNLVLAGMEMLVQLVTDEATSKQFLAQAPAGCLARIREAVRKHVLDKPGTERYSIMLKMHLAMTERGLQPPKVWPDPEAVKPNGCDDFPLSVIMIAWRKTEDGAGQQLMIGSDREEISLWNSHGLCEKRIKLEGHRPVHGIYSKDGKIGVAVVDISYGHDPNSALVVFNTEPPYSHIGSQLMIKLPEIEHCVGLTTNIDKTLYIVGGNDGANRGRVHSYIIDETSGVPNRQAGQMGRLASTTTICEVGFTLHSVIMFGMAKKTPVFIAGGGTPARLEMWELQGKKPAQRLILPDTAANRNSFVSSVACIEYHVVACSGTKVYQWNVRVKQALGGAKNPVRVLQLDLEAPARHIALHIPSDSKDSPLASKDRPFFAAAISTERLLYYVVFKEHGGEPECIEASISSHDDKDKMPLGAVTWAGEHPILYGGAADGSLLVFSLNP